MEATGSAEDCRAHAVAALPGGRGGLGLRSATRNATPAYWASWVDSLQVIQERAPDVAANVIEILTTAPSFSMPASLAEAERVRRTLLDHGGQDIPSWAEALDGARAPQIDQDDEVPYVRGWQRHAYFR